MKESFSGEFVTALLRDMSNCFRKCEFEKGWTKRRCHVPNDMPTDSDGAQPQNRFDLVLIWRMRRSHWQKQQETRYLKLLVEEFLL